MKLAIAPNEFAETAAVTLANLAALALLGLVGAYWTWQWFAPRPAPRLTAQAVPGGQGTSALELFGSLPRERITSVASGNAVRLAGVVAATEGRDAYAVVILDDKQIVAVRKGEEIAPGVILADVAPDHIELDRGGIRESLAWPEKPAVAEPPGQRTNR